MTAGAAPAGPAPTTRRHLALQLFAWSVAWMLLYAALPGVAHWVVYHAIGFAADTRLAAAVEFFVYEVPKVLFLLVAVVFAVGIVRTYFTPARTRALLAGRRESVGNVLAAGLGTVTPFCSCSAVPLFIGFVESGVPLGVTFSFLIAAPMVNEIAIVLLWGLVGARVTLLYVTTGLAIAIVAGWVIGRLRLERYVEDWVHGVRVGDTALPERLTFDARVAAGRAAVREIVGNVWPYVVVGIAVGAGIHGYVPAGALAGILGRDAWWSVPAAVLVGIPMYSNAAGIVPVVQALLGKGAAMGSVLAFMMSVIALSLPETIILRKVLRPPLIAVFLGVVAGGIILVGYLFNAVL